MRVLVGRTIRWAAFPVVRRLLHFLAALTGRRACPLVTLAAGGGLTRTLIVLLASRRPLRAGTPLAAGRGLGRALVAFLAGAHVLIRRRLLPAGATLAAGGRLGRASLLPGHVRQPKRSDGPTIDPSAGLEALLALERDQGLPGARRC